MTNKSNDCFSTFINAFGARPSTGLNRQCPCLQVMVIIVVIVVGRTAQDNIWKLKTLSGKIQYIISVSYGLFFFLF